MHYSKFYIYTAIKNCECGMLDYPEDVLRIALKYIVDPNIREKIFDKIYNRREEWVEIKL